MATQTDGNTKGLNLAECIQVGTKSAVTFKNPTQLFRAATETQSYTQQLNYNYVHGTVALQQLVMQHAKLARYTAQRSSNHS